MVTGRPLALIAAVTSAAAWLMPAASAAADRGRAVVRVGPQHELTRPSQAAARAPDGAVVEIEAGTYFRDVAVWPQNDLVIRGVGGRPHVSAIGRRIEQPAIWVFTGNDVTVENVEFSRARAADRRGAALYHSGAGLTVRSVYVHDNEIGLVADGSPGGDVVVENSVFAWNGGSGEVTPSIDIGRVRSLTLRYCHIFGAKAGDYVRSRAHRNRILYNRVADEALGTSRTAVDLPDGGSAYLIGNLFHKGQQSLHPTIIDFGRASVGPGDRLFVVNNTFVSDLHEARFIVTAGRAGARILNNIFSGAGEALVGEGRLRGNLRASDPGFVEKGTYNYRLTAESPAIDAGADPGRADGFSLVPAFEYLHPADAVPRRRRGAIDIGAHEWNDRNPILSGLPPNEWVTLPPLAGRYPARRAHAGAVYDTKRGRILIFGADTHFHDFDNAVHEFDPLYQRWGSHYASALPVTFRLDGRSRPVAGRDRLLPWAMHTYDNIVYDPANDALVVTSAPKHNSIRAPTRRGTRPGSTRSPPAPGGCWSPGAPRRPSFSRPDRPMIRRAT